MAISKRVWWKDAVVYQIWPSSFKDGNGDGLGDLQGIIESLDHIQSLGADVIWISPVYESPQVDQGYDVSNYERIHPPYGTMEDMTNLLKCCHERGLRVLMDLVINHTSDQHDWFKESRSSKDSLKRDWYIWRPARYENGQRKPPNNWRSCFGGSAWEWDPSTEEYYLHLFAVGQPDINWANVAMRKHVYQSSVKFWLDKGVDGFRIDTMGLFGKDQSFADAPDSDPCAPFNHQPDAFQVLGEIHELIAGYGDLMTVGEFGGLGDTATALRYVSASANRVNMGFQFETVCLGFALSSFDIKPHSLADFKQSVIKWQQYTEGTDGWATMFLENHDVPRSISRFASDKPEFRAAAAKTLALLQIACTGTLFLYQGQEIGMTNIPKSWAIEEYKDFSTQQYWQSETQSSDDPEVRRKAMANIQAAARDNSRTPMQWSSQRHAGFTDWKGGPWMRINENYVDINVEDQTQDEESVLSFWKKALACRKTYIDVLGHGSFHPIDGGDEAIFCFKKIHKGAAALVMLNMSDREQECRPSVQLAEMPLVLATHSSTRDSTLGPFEGRLYIGDEWTKP
ncbi:alpha amylase [Fusarium proliferatum]|nr:alpha amylase [Fusarium proliferatum]